MGVKNEMLPAIPVFAVGRDFAAETLSRATGRAQTMLDEATEFTPAAALRIGDAISRRWLNARDPGHCEEIDRITRLIGRGAARC